MKACARSRKTLTSSEESLAERTSVRRAASWRVVARSLRMRSTRRLPDTVRRSARQSFSQNSRFSSAMTTLLSPGCARTWSTTSAAKARISSGPFPVTRTRSRGTPSMAKTLRRILRCMAESSTAMPHTAVGSGSFHVGSAPRLRRAAGGMCRVVIISDDDDDDDDATDDGFFFFFSREADARDGRRRRRPTGHRRAEQHRRSRA
mmetsp:Transcript_9561/g.39039  ORF Transcript_9561/g.39039 Transcript_9561/m.39039 type:complete len:205 (-) Transcript_9561:2095-2709(-)